MVRRGTEKILAVLYGRRWSDVLSQLQVAAEGMLPLDKLKKRWIQEWFVPPAGVDK